MNVRGFNVGVLAAIAALLLFGTTEREERLVESTAHGDHIAALEARAASAPHDAAALEHLARGYLEIHQPGMAIGAIERASADVRALPMIDHLYGRALLQQGRSGAALEAETRVLAACGEASGDGDACAPWLVAAAARRARILEQLVQRGIEDARAHPESALIAYQAATRHVTLSVSTY